MSGRKNIRKQQLIQPNFRTKVPTAVAEHSIVQKPRHQSLTQLVEYVPFCQNSHYAIASSQQSLRQLIANAALYLVKHGEAEPFLHPKGIQAC